MLWTILNLPSHLKLLNTKFQDSINLKLMKSLLPRDLALMVFTTSDKQIFHGLFKDFSRPNNSFQRLMYA